MFTHLQIRVTDTAFPKIMAVPIKKNQIILGRSDEDDLQYRPDIDLVACNAMRNGISRRHALIETSAKGDIYLIDLGSHNGTFLDGEQLIPNERKSLKDGSHIQLGLLKMIVYIE